jgi:hypothetical protein
VLENQRVERIGSESDGGPHGSDKERSLDVIVRDKGAPVNHPRAIGAVWSLMV